MTKLLERQRNRRMAPFLKRAILVVATSTGLALASYLAVALGGLVLRLT
jgi:hypothetical protein